MIKPPLTPEESQALWQMIELAGFGNPVLTLSLTGQQRSTLYSLKNKGYVALSGDGRNFIVLMAPQAEPSQFPCLN